MRTRIHTAACLMAALWLSACGGGGTTASTADRCDLALQYANGQTGGYTITANLTESVPRKFNACPLQTIQSVRLSLCLDHPQVSELRAQMRLPDGSTRPLDLANTASGSSCLITGQSFTLSVPSSTLQAFTGLLGDWSVGVTDIDQVSNTRVGYLVGWSMHVEGLK